MQQAGEATDAADAGTRDVPAERPRLAGPAAASSGPAAAGLLGDSSGPVAARAAAPEGKRSGRAGASAPVIDAVTDFGPLLGLPATTPAATCAPAVAGAQVGAGGAAAGGAAEAAAAPVTGHRTPHPAPEPLAGPVGHQDSAAEAPGAPSAAAGADAAAIVAGGDLRTAGPAHPGPATSPSAPPAAVPGPAQAAPVLVAMSQAEGSHRLTVQLAPEELGRVQISVTRGADGSSDVAVTVERSATLALVKADSAQLHAALDKAGIAAPGRVLHFHLAETAQPGLPVRPGIDGTAAAHPAAEASAPAVRPPAASQGGGFDSDGGQNGLAGQTPSFGGGGGQRPDTGQSSGHGSPGGRGTADGTVTAFIGPDSPDLVAPGRLGRSAIDITA